MKHMLQFFGIGGVCISAVVMIYGHEYVVSGGVFILGMALIGYAYAKLPDSEKPKINTKAVNKNIQTLNDILFGKEKKEDSGNPLPEQCWYVSTRDNCRDLLITNVGNYCYYGGRRGYCTFKGCPRRIK